MSELISKKVVVTSVVSNVPSDGNSSSWLLNTTYVALDTLGSACQAGLNIHEDAMVAILNSPTLMTGALLFLIPLFILMLYGITRIRIF